MRIVCQYSVLSGRKLNLPVQLQLKYLFLTATYALRHSCSECASEPLGSALVNPCTRPARIHRLHVDKSDARPFPSSHTCLQHPTLSCQLGYPAHREPGFGMNYFHLF
eukprot:gene19091-6408_t